MKARKDIQAKDGAQGEVPKALREKLKKAKAAKGMLRDLEEQVRSFVDGWEKKQLSRAVERRDKGADRKGSLSMDSEDEEIVFIGRNGQMRDVPPSPTFMDSEDGDSDEGELDHRKAERARLIFESLANDQGASFGYDLFLDSSSAPSFRSLVVSSRRTLAKLGIMLHQQSVACPLNCFLLRPSYLVANYW